MLNIHVFNVMNNLNKDNVRFVNGLEYDTTKEASIDKTFLTTYSP
jgi:hypothetical protein